MTNTTDLEEKIRILNKEIDILVQTTKVCLPEYFDLFFCDKNGECDCLKCNRKYARKYAKGELPSKMLKVITLHDTMEQQHV